MDRFVGRFPSSGADGWIIWEWRCDPWGWGWGWTDGGWQLAMCRGGEVAVGRGWDRQH